MLVCFFIFSAASMMGLLCIRCLGPKGFMDIPGGRHTHALPVPRVGGIAFGLALLLSALISGADLPLGPIHWTALGVTAAMGILDDRFDLPARGKVFLSLGLAMGLSGLSLAEISEILNHIPLFGLQLSHATAFLLLLMLYWGIPHSFNLIDGANGLAIGYGVIVSFVLFIQGTIGPAIPMILLGLLVLNWPVPRLFLGDCGSLSLGLLFAMLAHRTFSFKNPEAILWLFAYPILDVILVVAIRASSGQNLIHGDRNHLHHQLMGQLGRHQDLAVPILWLLAACCAAMPILDGAWRLIPWAGLGSLVLMTSLFFLLSLKKGSSELNTQV